jgi:hypothetical protein
MPRLVIDPAVPERAWLDNEIARMRGLDVGELRARWHTMFRRRAPSHLPRHLLFRVLAYRLQADRLGELDAWNRVEWFQYRVVPHGRTKNGLQPNKAGAYIAVS